MKFRSSAAVVMASALMLVGCSDSDGSKEKVAAPTLDEAKAMVVDYFSKAFVGDAGACQHESAQFAKAEDEMNGTADCTERIESIKDMLDDGAPLMDVAKTVVTVTKAEGGKAVADVEHELEGFGGTYELVVQNGVWVFDAAIEAADDSDGSEDDAIALASAFCQVEVGVSRASVEEWMGEPTEETTDSDGQPELSWSVNQDNYTVWLDGSDKVASLSSSTPREGDPCAE